MQHNISSRRVAAEMLSSILSGQTLEQAGGNLSALTGQDRAFAFRMVMDSLRHYGQIIALLQNYIDKLPPLRGSQARSLLMIGATQLLILQTPAHAAIHETVNACQYKEKPYRGLINAVLRKISKLDKLELPRTDVFINTPASLQNIWREAYGTATAEMIAQAHQQQPPLDLQFKTQILRDQWHDENTQINTRKIGATALRLYDAPLIEQLAGYAQGAWWVQDISASLAAPLLSGHEHIWDICAAPGGKTLQLAARGNKVSALDISAKRLQRLQANLRRCQLGAEIIEADFLKWQPLTKINALLLDAPCSATGTLRRHPDLTHQQKNMQSLLDLQRAMLQKAAQILSPTGMMVYCTCALDPREGEEQITAFLAQNSEFTISPIQAAEIPAEFADALKPQGWLRITPALLAEYGHCDGFFIARIARKDTHKKAAQ